MDILNHEELDEWLFQRAVTLGHPCHGLLGPGGINVGFKDTTTGETIGITYGGTEAPDTGASQGTATDHSCTVFITRS